MLPILYAKNIVRYKMKTVDDPATLYSNDKGDPWAWPTDQQALKIRMVILRKIRVVAEVKFLLYREDHDQVSGHCPTCSLIHSTPSSANYRVPHEEDLQKPPKSPTTQQTSLIAIGVSHNEPKCRAKKRTTARDTSGGSGQVSAVIRIKLEPPFSFVLSIALPLLAET